MRSIKPYPKMSQVELVKIPQTSTHSENHPLHLDVVDEAANCPLALDRYLHEHISCVVIY